MKRVACLLVSALLSALSASCSDADPEGLGADAWNEIASPDPASPDAGSYRSPEDPGEDSVDWSRYLPEDDGGSPDDTDGSGEAAGGPAPGEFGYPCTADAECLSGPCVDVGSQTVCTTQCMEECPGGFSCLNAGAGKGKFAYLCVPDFFPFCRPCLSDKDCSRFTGDDVGRCREISPEQGSFCTLPCDHGNGCPDEFGCDAAGFCVPEVACDCREFGVNEGFETECSVVSLIGACKGHRVCSADGLGQCDAAVPEAEWCDGKDNDCNGTVDDGVPQKSCWLSNEWGSCTGTSECAEGVVECVGKEATAEVCDGLDNDCDGETDEIGAFGCNPFHVDWDDDGYGGSETLCVCADQFAAAVTVANLVDNDLDCNDANPAIHVGAAEVCDGLDNDCNGVVDDLCDKDGDGWCKDAPAGGLKGPVCLFPEADCNDQDPTVSPGAPELCDGKDNDCSGATDEGCDLDGDGYCGVAPSAYGPSSVCKHPEVDCDDLDAGVHPGAAELCNGHDDDCTAMADEGCDDDDDGWCEGPVPEEVQGCITAGGKVSTSCPGVQASCPNGFGDCDDSNAKVKPLAGEACNGKDDDCDGKVDESVDKDGDGFCAAGTEITTGCMACPLAPVDCQDFLATVSPEAEDEPDMLGLDSNCDGMDGDAAQSVFVSAAKGNDTWPGTQEQPLKTIQAGINRAAIDAVKKHVLVAGGDYYESLALKKGVEVWGSCDPAKQWNPSTLKKTVLHGGAIAVTASNINAHTVLARLVVYAAKGTDPGQSSVGVLASSSPSLNLIGIEVHAGAGAAGSGGAAGAGGLNGAGGESGSDGCFDAEWYDTTCYNSWTDNTCPGHADAGTGAGKYTCGGRGDGMGKLEATGDWSGNVLVQWDNKLEAEPSCCFKKFGGAKGGAPGVHIDSGGADGTDGGAGVSGKDGAAGLGGSLGKLSATGMKPANGGNGGAGDDGCGGGGGGMGDNTTAWVFCDAKGGGGGGGGAGGTAGTGGKGGGGGGSSIAIALYKSNASISFCELHTAVAGSGGPGGNPGKGGKGGTGGSGGPGYEGSGHGGDGGKGGAGGSGGAGGGGGGGSSVGILYTAGSQPQIASTTYFLGAAGKGAPGGSTLAQGPVPNPPAGGWSAIKGKDGVSLTTTTIQAE